MCPPAPRMPRARRYLFKLADAMREFGVHNDTELFELEVRWRSAAASLGRFGVHTSSANCERCGRHMSSPAPRAPPAGAGPLSPRGQQPRAGSGKRSMCAAVAWRHSRQRRQQQRGRAGRGCHRGIRQQRRVSSTGMTLLFCKRFHLTPSSFMQSQFDLTLLLAVQYSSARCKRPPLHGLERRRRARWRRHSKALQTQHHGHAIPICCCFTLCSVNFVPQR